MDSADTVHLFVVYYELICIARGLTCRNVIGWECPVMVIIIPSKLIIVTCDRLVWPARPSFQPPHNLKFSISRKQPQWSLVHTF